MRTYVGWLVAIALVALVVTGCERKVTNEITQPVAANASYYVGSDACQSCHASIYESFMKTGHPYKLSYATDAQDPNYYPFTQVKLPSDLTWNDVYMIIGGFWWKARYINNDGYIYTGPDRQYNFATDAFVAYDGTAPGTKPYSCGPCHTTGYRSDGHRDGKEGLVGDWAFNGVQCEECHGPGGLHVESPYEAEMVVDRSNEACGRCHSRGSPSEIDASGDFIKHHEQWDEMYRTKHASLQCVTCHDPHVSLHPNNPDRAAAIKIQCENCHYQEAESYRNAPIDHASVSFNGQPITCIDCHMAKAAKSAVGNSVTLEGDIHSHSWRINPDSTAQMFYTGTDGHQYAFGYLTVDYACKHCHPSMTKARLAVAAADSVHAPIKLVCE
jgi:formate-dependent nitrite reductase cytochrome c552 subunit